MEVENETPRAYTAEEAREKFLEAVRAAVHFWVHAKLNPDPERSEIQHRCDGVAFSILNVIDGTTGGMPCLDLVLRPHEDDKAYCEGEGENWFEDGQVINDDDDYLHDHYYKKEADEQPT